MGAMCECELLGFRFLLHPVTSHILMSMLPLSPAWSWWHPAAFGPELSSSCRLLEEESSKRAELEKWHLEQQQAIQMTEAEKQELENQRVLKEQALQEAMEQLAQLELERKQALEQYEVGTLGPADP